MRARRPRAQGTEPGCGRDARVSSVHPLTGARSGSQVARSAPPGLVRCRSAVKAPSIHLRFSPAVLPETAGNLRSQVRDLLEETRAAGVWLGGRIVVVGPQPGAQPSTRRGRFHRHDLATAVRRFGAELPGALRRHRGTAGGGRADRVPLVRRPPDRPEHPAFRHRGAEAALPAADRPRRDLLRRRHERARLGFGPGLDPHPRRAHRRRLAGQRFEDLDLLCAPGGVLRRAAPHGAEVGQAACRDEPGHHRPQELERDHGPPHHRPARPSRLQRSVLRGHLPAPTTACLAIPATVGRR